IQVRMIADNGAEQLRPLRGDGSYQQAAIASSPDRQFLRIGVLVLDQPFRCADEIVENVLLFFQHAGLVPGFAELSSPTQIRNRINSAPLHPRGGSGIESRQQAYIESAVAVKDGWCRAIRFVTLAVSQKHGHTRAVF